MENEPELHQKLIARGRRYFELNKATSLQDYYGDRFPRVYKDVSMSGQRRMTVHQLIVHVRSLYESLLMRIHTGESFLQVRMTPIYPVRRGADESLQL